MPQKKRKKKTPKNIGLPCRSKNVHMSVVNDPCLSTEFWNTVFTLESATAETECYENLIKLIFLSNLRFLNNAVWKSLLWQSVI